MIDVIIIGCGGLGVETVELINDINSTKPYQTYRIAGFVDSDEKMHGKLVQGFPVLGGLEVIKNMDNPNVVIAIANCKIRKNIWLQIKDCCNFLTLIHPSVKIPATSSVGDGVLIFANCVISVNVMINSHIIICPKCGIGHGSVICSFSSLMWNVNISGNVLAMSFTYFGTNSTVLQELVIEPHATIGAGAVVIKNVDVGSTMIGVPAKAK